ncbi:SsrA-binding protein [Ehrlichia ruminantium]|uniref:SsrA-binding protein n=1 Tax=Ehrlichia ruminantium (strain Gardel) TaxID=302409 RepID=SSRP_EHRRG|nr:SsrA-binding protein SmpB [Ehrlichia ruminantium]Q5FF69.1 RecName: Full=SsrA-binding protein; AltName: Full=Small protein B [Ehrlichia ruminantium str. Gardel]QLK52004.1 SsrA-binding protein SmpB [Ehrlichia ruminantium]QLK53837.1 SsrA-binding protein SmpB [Ehrlichia ruminantium]CAI27523.1 SsrA-binding protein [Ehrlichia ruminantium str. Gardel]GAT75888.1 SsrA-binding protein [Ehrlichia ruminantium]
MDIIIENRKVRFNYFIIQEFDAGIVLIGSEVKSLRQRKVSIAESYVTERNMELWLCNLHISEYTQANTKNHNPTRPRKLLLKKKQIYKISGNMKNDGFTVVPLFLYFNDKGIAKAKIVIVKGKKLHDKRETIKARDWNREKNRILRGG